MFKSSCEARKIRRQINRWKDEERKCTDQHEKLVMTIKSLDETITYLTSKNFKKIGRSTRLPNVVEECKILQTQNTTFIDTINSKKTFLIRELNLLKNHIHSIQNSIEDTHCKCFKCNGQ